MCAVRKQKCLGYLQPFDLNVWYNGPAIACDEEICMSWSKFTYPRCSFKDSPFQHPCSLNCGQMSTVEGVFLRHKQNQDGLSHESPHYPPPPHPKCKTLCLLRSKPWLVLGAKGQSPSRVRAQMVSQVWPWFNYEINPTSCLANSSTPGPKLGWPLGHSSGACQKELASHSPPGSHPAGLAGPATGHQESQ